MKRPTWATVVGILGIIFGAFGILGAGQMILTPMIMSMQRRMLGAMRTSIEAMEESARKQQEADRKHSTAAESETDEPDDWAEDEAAPPRPPVAPFRSMFGLWDKMTRTPPWFTTWSIVGGLLGMCITGAYLYASITLLQVKSWAIGFFYVAVGIDVAYAVTKVIVQVMALSSSMMAAAMIPSVGFGIVANAVLLAVVATSDKQAFQAAAT